MSPSGPAVPPRRIGVIGGSIAGCAAASLLLQAGHEVTVLERSASALEGRGAGIVVPTSTVALMRERGLVGDDLTMLHVEARRFSRCTPDRRGTSLISDVRIPGGGEAMNWSVLWRALRRRIPDAHYRSGWEVGKARALDAGGWELTGPQGTLAVDLVIGADGYRSVVRGWIGGPPTVTSAGYILWRGTLPEAAAPACAAAIPADRPLTLGFGRGHLVVYPIPAVDGSGAPGRRLLNWAIYDGLAEEDLPALFGSSDRAAALRPINPDRVSPAQRRYLQALAEREFPDFVVELLAATLAPFAHPIHDLTTERYATETMALVGDAGTVCRPHAAGGVGKAIKDAFALAETVADGSAEAMATYDRDRTREGNALVEIGRLLGRSLVTHPPDWASITGPELEDVLLAPYQAGLRGAGTAG